MSNAVFAVGGADGEWFAADGAEGALVGADDVEFMLEVSGKPQQLGVARAYRGLHGQGSEDAEQESVSLQSVVDGPR